RHSKYRTSRPRVLPAPHIHALHRPHWTHPFLAPHQGHSASRKLICPLSSVQGADRVEEPPRPVAVSARTKRNLSSPSDCSKTSTKGLSCLAQAAVRSTVSTPAGRPISLSRFLSRASISGDRGGFEPNRFGSFIVSNPCD